MRRTSLVLVLSCLASLTTTAQQTAGRPEQPPQPPITFRVEVNYVEIDAIVTDAQGNFVRNLTRSDFQVFEDGTAQTLETFALVDLPVERPDAPLFKETPIEPDVRSNQREFDGRVYVLVLDDLNTHFARSQRVRAAAREFVERHLGENDIAAVVQTGGTKDGAQEFTSSRSRLLRAIDSFMGQKARSATLEKLDDYYLTRGIRGAPPPRDMSEQERAFKARQTLSSLKRIADYLSGVRGRRKAVIFFSEGIDYDVNNVIENRYASDIIAETRDAIAAATRTNVSFYGIDPRGLGGLSAEGIELQAFPEDNSITPTDLQNELRLSQDSLRTISGDTGGFAAVNRNDFASAFSRIVADNSSYYLLGYYSKDTRRDGRTRHVDVRLNRPGLQVRARKEYVAPKGRPEPSKRVNDQTSVELQAALDSPVAISGLPFRVFAAPLKGSGSKGSVAVTLEIDGPTLRFNERNGVFEDDVEVAVLAVDSSGKPRDGGRDLLNLRLRPDTHTRVSGNGVRITRRLEVPPGRYQLRIGARETGRAAIGSVLYDLDVPDFSRGPLSMSGILIASASASHIPTANPDQELKAVMPASPTAVRDFPAGDTLSLFAEVYDNLPKTPHRVAIKTTVVSDTGTTVFSNEGERRSEELKGAGGGYGHTVTIPLKGLAAGRYVLRVEARALLADGATAVREVEFRIK